MFGLLSVAPGCTGTENNNNNNNNNTGECTGRQDCWKKRCPQLAKSCVEGYLAPKSDITGDQLPPELVSCTAANKCEDIPTEQLGGGQIDVQMPEVSAATKSMVKFLLLYIFDKKDMDGKDITCDRIKQIAESDPKQLMSDTWGRYYPPRDYTSATVYPVDRPGDSLPLKFGVQVPLVPAGERVVAVFGFCDTDGQRPSEETKPKWISCKENVAFVAGQTANDIPLDFPLKNGDSCF